MIETIIVVAIIAWIAYTAGQKKAEDRAVANQQDQVKRRVEASREAAEKAASAHGHVLGPDERDYERPGFFERHCQKADCRAYTWHTSWTEGLQGHHHGGDACFKDCPVTE